MWLVPSGKVAVGYRRWNSQMCRERHFSIEERPSKFCLEVIVFPLRNLRDYMTANKQQRWHCKSKVRVHGFFSPRPPAVQHAAACARKATVGHVHSGYHSTAQKDPY